MQKTFREVVEEQISIRSLAVVLVSILFFVGYGLWTTADTGTLTIDSPVYGTRVIVDERSVGILNDAKDTLRLSERTGKHVVLVSKNGYWPWRADVEIKKHETTEIHPFIIPQNVPLESITQFLSSGEKNMNPDYTKALSLFENQSISTDILPLAEATRIKGVTHADYLPGHTDALLVATRDGVFAVGVEKNEHPNFQPVYKGANPSFAKGKDGVLYIKDGVVILRAVGFGK